MELNNLFENLTLNQNLLFFALIAGILIDFATGIAKAYKKDKRISSSKLRDGGFKKIGILLTVIICFGLSALFSDTKHIIANAAMCYYVYTEIISILENLKELGIPRPPVLLNLLGKEH